MYKYIYILYTHIYINIFIDIYLFIFIYKHFRSSDTCPCENYLHDCKEKRYTCIYNDTHYISVIYVLHMYVCHIICTCTYVCIYMYICISFYRYMYIFYLYNITQFLDRRFI